MTREVWLVGQWVSGNLILAKQALYCWYHSHDLVAQTRAVN